MQQKNEKGAESFPLLFSSLFSRFQLCQFVPDFNKIVKGKWLVIRVPEQCCRVVSSHQKHAIPLNEFPVLFGHFEVRVNEFLGGNASHAHDNLRADKAHLFPEPLQTGILLVRLWVTVLWRTAFHHVGNVDILVSGEANRLQHFVQELAGAAHKRLALQVLVFTWALPNEHDIGLRITNAKHQVVTGLPQSALLTLFTGSVQFLKTVIHNTSSKLRKSATHFTIGTIRRQNVVYWGSPTKKRGNVPLNPTEEKNPHQHIAKDEALITQFLEETLSEDQGIEFHVDEAQFSEEDNKDQVSWLPGNQSRKRMETRRQIFRQAFSLKGDMASYDTIQDRIDSNSRVTGTNLIILICAIAIASIGLNMNSTAVIIGAMLISPLMGTIQGMGFGIATIDLHRFRKALMGFLFQVTVALLTSIIYFLLSPINTATSELLARTSPAVWDVLIATFGGLAGIVGITRKDATSNIIPGVAIATALMPPLCTCGYSIAHGQWHMLLGAGYLFIINTVFIMLTAVIILIALEVPQVGNATQKTKKRLTKLLIRNAAIIAVPSIFLAVVAVHESNATDAANATPITEEGVSSVATVEEAKVLFPKVSGLQIGVTETADENGDLVRQNIVLVTLSEEFTKEEKATFEEWITVKYDQSYTILYELNELPVCS